MEAEFKLTIVNILKQKIIVADDENNYDQDLSDVVISIGYDLLVTKDGMQHRFGQDIKLSPPENIENFISFEDIDEEIVLEWLNAKVDMDAKKERMELEVDKLINPPNEMIWNPFSIETPNPSE